jgi:hypothetical protein
MEKSKKDIRLLKTNENEKTRDGEKPALRCKFTTISMYIKTRARLKNKRKLTMQQKEAECKIIQMQK